MENYLYLAMQGQRSDLRLRFCPCKIRPDDVRDRVHRIAKVRVEAVIWEAKRHSCVPVRSIPVADSSPAARMRNLEALLLPRT